MSSTTESQTLEISIVVPLYNEEESLSELVDQIKKSLPYRSFEIIFVDDGSVTVLGMSLSNWLRLIARLKVFRWV